MSPSAKRFLLFFLIPFTLNIAVPAPGQTTSTISQAQLLAWTIGGMTRDHELAALKRRGLQSNSNVLIAAMTSAGADDAVLSYLRKSTVVKKEDTSARFALLVKVANAAEGNDYELAFKYLHDASSTDSKNADLHFAAAGILRKAAIWEGMAAEERIVTQLLPDFVDAWQGLSYAYYRRGDPARSADFARTAVKLNPKDSDSHKFLGLALGDLGENDNALTEFGEALRLDPSNSAVYYDRSIVYEHQGKFDEAIKDSKKATGLKPDDWSYWYGLGIDYGNKDDFENAIAAYRRAKSLNPEALEVRQNLGATYCASQRHADAIAEFRELLKIDPSWNMARPCLAKSLAATNDLKGAITVGEEFLRYEPQDQYMLHAMAQWYVLADRRKDAEPLWARLLAMELNTNGDDTVEYSHLLANRAQLFDSEKKYEQSDADFRRALTILKTPGNADSGDVANVQRYYDVMLAHWHGPPEHSASAAAFEANLPHAASATGITAQSQWQSQLQAAQIAMGKRNYAKAAHIFNQALVTARSIVPQTGEVPRTLEQYSSLYARQNNFEEAIKLLHRAVNETRQIGDAGWGEEPSLLAELGDMYLMQRKYPEAESAFNDELKLVTATHGPRDPAVLMADDHVASAYEGEKRYAEAELLLKKYLKGTEEFYGPEDFLVSTPLDHLGGFYVQTKQFDKAEVMYRRQLAITEKKFGPDSRMLSGPLYSLANCLRELGRPEEAKPLDARREIVEKR